MRAAVTSALSALIVGLAPMAGAQTIAAARYDGPTTRYPHGVLGDDVEYTTLTVTLSDGRSMRATWPDGMVFEDLAPRLADVTGDGAPEVIVVESSATQGGRLAIWGLAQGQLTQLATTPHIGTRFRWLAPVAVADLDGDGTVEVAYVDRPHLAKVLRVWRVAAQGDGRVRLTEVAQAPGLTNHQIGWDFIAGGLRDCGQGPEMITADATWTATMATVFDGQGLRTRQIKGSGQPADLEAALACR